MPSSATETDSQDFFISTALVLRALTEGALILDNDGHIRQINPAAARLLSIEPETVLNQSVDLLPAAAALRTPGGPQSGTLQVGERTIGFEKRPLLAHDDAQQMLGILIVLHDLTAELAERRRQYDFFCQALHDVRVPLQAISGAAEGLMRGWLGPLTDDQHEFAALIKDNADRQGELFNYLYDAYALSTRAIQIDLERISVDTVIHEAEHEFAPRFAARQQSFAVDLPANLPSILANRRRLRQILIALLGNAHHYTYPGGSAVLRVRQAGAFLQVEVEDTGVGIRTEDQPKIFTPFFRGKNPLQEGRYGGLNLLIAKLLVELHGGRMWFASVEGQGSTFAFTLPVV